jgi:hypothetical protein
MFDGNGSWLTEVVMVSDSLDDFLKSLTPPSYLEHLESCGKVRRTGAFVQTRSGALAPVYEVLQSPEEAKRSWQ